MQKGITINSKNITLLKPITAADYKSKTVLTDSSWEYVELWLKRHKDVKSKEALFYWQQAKNFFDASECLPLNSKPLTSYYCCMNATKALLCIHGTDVEDIHHGISHKKNVRNNYSLEKEVVTFKGGGVLNELCKYLGEDANKHDYTIKDLLYNIPCIHRAFTITYSGATELFIPINNLKFIREDSTAKCWIEFCVPPRYANGKALKNLPKNYEHTHAKSNNYYIRRKSNRFKWDIHSDWEDRISNLVSYHNRIRKELFYITGEQTLWYVKKEISNNKHIIHRSSLTLIFAVMHWMSELVRYNPQRFEMYMESKQNWLLHEFIDIALYQFIDEISCELTHQQILSTRHR